MSYLRSFIHTLTVGLILIWSVTAAKAEHIVGGDMYYECVRVNNSAGIVTFKIYFTLYRDSKSGGAQFDNPAQIGIYSGNGTDWTFVRELNVSVLRTTALDPDTGIPCLAVPGNIGVERGDYEFEVTLDIKENESYVIAYQRCCRNNTITNIVNPGDAGALYYTTISPLAQTACDNSPVFKEFPPIVICLNQDINFDHSAVDKDLGDSIVYSFCTPRTAGGIYGAEPGEDPTACFGISPDPSNCPPRFEEVTFTSAYSESQPMGGDPVISIDPVTGIISGFPDLQGQYVVGVCAKVYRDGELISELIRDFQFNVASCDPQVVALIEADSTVSMSHYQYLSCGETELNLLSKSRIESFITSYDWQFPLPNNDTLSFENKEVTAQFPGPGEYNGRLIINKNSEFELCRDTALVDVIIYPPVEAAFEFDYDTCVYSPIQLINNSVFNADPKSYRWLENNITFSTEEEPVIEFDQAGEKLLSLIVTDENNCQSRVDTNFRYYPIPVNVEINPSKFISCAPDVISLQAISGLLDSNYTYTWTVEDVGDFQEQYPQVEFTEAGVYDVNLNIESPVGCTEVVSFSDFITMREGPTAGFSYSPQDISIFNNEVTFTDESQDAVSWQWLIGEDQYFTRNLNYTFQDTGVVVVNQIVRHENNCIDTAKALIDVIPVATYFMPNAFTPNEDNINETFKGKGYTESFQDFSMVIFNRWGDLMYETKDPEAGWNGRVNNDGAICPGGTYVYRVRYIGPRNEEKEIRGHLTLLR